MGSLMKKKRARRIPGARAASRSSAPLIVEESSSSMKEPTEWPPVWKPVKESPQFKYGLLEPYLREWELERHDHIDDSDYPPTRLGLTVKDSHKKLKKFLQQVRDSRGYDVDVIPPKFMNSPFFPVPLDRVLNFELPSKIMNAKVNFVIDKINSQAAIHGENYVFHQMEKVVEARMNKFTLVTFSVKEVAPNPDHLKTVQAMVYTLQYYNFELKEWRFKSKEVRSFKPPEEAKMFKAPGMFKQPLMLKPYPWALADCILPEEVIIRIISYLPLKTIYSFKFVCKAWCNLLSSRDFNQTRQSLIWERNPPRAGIVLKGVLEARLLSRRQV